MDPEERRLKKIREAAALRDVPPEESLRMGFSLIRFARKFRGAVERA